MIRSKAFDWHEQIAYHKGPPKIENPLSGGNFDLDTITAFNPTASMAGNLFTTAATGAYQTIRGVARGEGVDSWTKKNTAGDLFKDQVRAFGAPIRNVQNNVMPTVSNGVKMMVGSETDKEKGVRLKQEAIAAEGEARQRAYADITASDLDSISRSELVAAYNSGEGSGSLAAKLNAARSGKGVYAVRKINENQKKALSLTPGRAQTSARYSIIS